MQCPRCRRTDFNPEAACTHCGFSGPPGQVEELAHIVYLLGELEAWSELKQVTRTRIRSRYVRRREELEAALGLRRPALAASEVRTLQWELFCLSELQEEVNYWLEEGWVHPGPAGRMLLGIEKRVETLRQRLEEEDAPPAPRFNGVQEGLRLLDYLEGMLNRAHSRGHFVDEEAHGAALADLQLDRRDLEIEAGLRPPLPEAVPAAKAAPEPAPTEEAISLPLPREPITWDRIWQTLLSERTLNVLLFLGAFLLMASATTYVVYNWEKLSPIVQLAFIILFTLSFYGAGWFLRVRMGLRASGIAITAVGSLLIPLDFYAVFVAGGVWPAETWPWVWLMASAVCLPVYAFTAVRIRAEFFGYLVALAAGSLLSAVLRVLGAPTEWWLAALVALAMASLVLAYRLRGSNSAWSLLAEPLRFSAFLATAAILLLGIGWWIAGAGGFDMDASLAVSWTLGVALFAHGAVSERSPLLGRAAATALPVALFLLLRLAFDPLEVEAPWYALGWAVLAPVYLLAGHGFQARSVLADETEAPTLRAHGRTATLWGLALVAIAAVWSVFDLWAAAATYAVLALAVILAVRTWERPRALPVASLLAFAATTFGLAAAHMEPAELCLGWALLALLHVLGAIRLRTASEYAARVFAAALAIAALALLPPLIFGHELLLTYALGNWMGLATWLLWLDHSGKQPGLGTLLGRLGPMRTTALHWMIATPLPFFAVLLGTRFWAADAWLGILLAALAWLCVAITRLRRASGRVLEIGNWRLAWLVVGLGCSLAAPLLAFYYYDQALLGVTLLLASGLYFGAAWALHEDRWLIPAGLALPAGLLILLDFWAVPWARQSVVMAVVVAAYLLGGVWLENRRGVPRDFVVSLYAVGHLVALGAVILGLGPGVEHLSGDLPWPDAERLWAAGGQLILGATYGLFAWFHARERWAHLAAWLGVMAGGLVATAYSQGRGSSAFKAALLAAVYVSAERALASGRLQRRRPAVERAWALYRRALLIAGWTVSAAAVVLALLRNLVLLGGGPVREAWAIAGLLAVTALYALSAGLYRRRLFVWLAGVVVVAPWTLLATWGWFLWASPSALTHYALSWTVLACLELVLGLALTQATAGSATVPLDAAGDQPEAGEEEEGNDYGLPLRAIANALLPFALFWGVADPTTSRFTWGLGLAFYVASAVADHRRGLAGWRGARFLYPAVAVAPLWAVYVLNTFVPDAPYEWYGLLLLGLSLPLLAVGRWLRHVDTADALPLYLGAYGVAIVGTLLVAHEQPLFATALTFDALLCVLSAWIFREPSWGYAAAALAPAAMLVALAQGEVLPERRGWWLIGLGAIYVALAWVLRRSKRVLLRPYAVPPLVMAFVVVALGLPPSSLERVGAFWGYLASALIYAIVAVWLRQPLLLAATAGLLAVPYGVALLWLAVEPTNYGLSLFPGVAGALALAHLLDWRSGRSGSILPSWKPGDWHLALLFEWWAAPWYVWGYAGALVAAGLTLWTPSGQAVADSIRLAVVLGLAALTFLHATWRFRSRGALLLAGALGQAAVLAIIHAAGWLEYPSWAALAFTPVTVVTAALALTIGQAWHEGPPLSASWRLGWSWPVTVLLTGDLVAGQAAAMASSGPGAFVTTVHGLLVAVLATVWVQPVLPYVGTALGVVGTLQAMAWAGAEPTVYPVGLALLALGYGLPGYAIEVTRLQGRRARIWVRPLEWMALGLSLVALLWMAVFSLDVVGVLVHTFLGGAMGIAHYAAQLQMVMWTLALSGLLYLATAAVRRRWVLGYAAVAMLLGAWALWWRFFLDMTGFQWYAVPAGLYLLGVGWMEWQQGRRALARWIDRAGMLVWLGTAWLQSLPATGGAIDDGWPYALLLGAESLLLIWWGSARRQRRFLYLGVVAMVVNVVTQSIEPLLSANRWIVFGIAGLLLVGLAVLVERRLDAIRELSAEVRGRLEGWE